MLNYELHGNVALLHFDDGKANAVGHDFIDAMNSGLDRAQAEAKAVVLTGREGKFSAGFDLNEFSKGQEAATALVAKGVQMFHRLFTLPQPLVGACNGHAIAAGAFMMLCCDTRFGLNGNYKLGANETAIGMTLPPFAIALIQARLTRKYFTMSAIQGKLFTPEEAVDVGYLDTVVSSVDELRENAMTAAAALAELPGEPYANNKMLIRANEIAIIQKNLGTSE